MKGDKIKYKKSYKYQLAQDYTVWVGVVPEKPIDTPFLSLGMAGVLTIKAGYAWDGATNPAWDTKTNMRASLVHDALYQLMREEKISVSFRRQADSLLRDLMVEDGAFKIRAWYYFRAVQLAGLKVATCEGERETLIAP